MTDSLLVQTAADVLSRICDDPARLAAERDGWVPDMWAAVAEIGLPWISVPESAGGQGGELTDAFDVLRVAGRHAVPLPIAETGVLGGWLLAATGLPVPEGPVTVIPPRGDAALRWDGHTITGVASRVPWARAANRIVTIVPHGGDHAVLVLDPAAVRIEHRTNLAGEPRDTVHLDGVVPLAQATAPSDVDIDALACRGALTRVALMAGALERVLEITLRYSREREQFGRPIAQFQAVQQHLVHIAQQSAVLGMAADVATREFSRHGGRLEVWAAKVLADDAARIATRAAHQAHGAMGMTQEYPLHHVTRRLWAWTREYGGGARWAERLGTLVVQRGADGLYPLVTDGSAALSG